MEKIELLTLYESDIDYIYDNWIGQSTMLGQTTLNKVANKSELKELYWRKDYEKQNQIQYS